MTEEEKIYLKQREALTKFMEVHSLGVGNWAKKAGISEGTIRHFLSGRNKSITAANLEKLAKAANVEISALFNFSSEDVNLQSIDRELFIRSYCEIADFLQTNQKKISPEICANIILSWYEISSLKKGGEFSVPFQDLLKKMLVNFK